MYDPILYMRIFILKESSMFKTRKKENPKATTKWKETTTTTESCPLKTLYIETRNETILHSYIEVIHGVYQTFYIAIKSTAPPTWIEFYNVTLPIFFKPFPSLDRVKCALTSWLPPVRCQLLFIFTSTSCGEWGKVRKDPE